MLRKAIESGASLIEVLKLHRDELFSLDYPEFIKIIQTLIPESLLMKGKASVSAEGVAANKPAAKNVYGLTEDEEIRAFSGLLRFKDVLNGTRADYDRFVECQIQMKKPVLSYDAFLAIRSYVLNTLNSSEDYAAAMWSILCNDLGKVYSVNLNEKNIGHDAILVKRLKTNPEMFAGFSKLPVNYQQFIIDGFASGCDISQLEQLELSASCLQSLVGMNQQTLKLYYLHTIFDVAGAAAHFKPNGSLTMHAETWNFFNALRACVEKLQTGCPSDQVYNDYLDYRGRCVGIQNTSPVNTALIRIAGLSRLATEEQGKTLLSVWETLPENIKATLVKELNVHGAKDERAIFIGYGVAMLINPQGALKKELPEAAATAEGLRIGLINMATAFTHARKIVGHQASTEMFVAECDEVARFLGKEPKKSLEMEWHMEAGSDRRVDFKLVAPQLQAAVTTESMLTPHVAQSIFRPAEETKVNPPAAPAPATPKL
jgi:hypothetical protein